MSRLGRPPLPRATLPVRYALLDNRGHVRALTESILGAVHAFIKTKFSEDDADAPGNTDAALEAMWAHGWEITELRKRIEIAVSMTALDIEEVLRRRDGFAPLSAVSDDEFIIWTRPGNRSAKVRPHKV